MPRLLWPMAPQADGHGPRNRPCFMAYSYGAIEFFVIERWVVAQQIKTDFASRVQEIGRSPCQL